LQLLNHGRANDEAPLATVAMLKRAWTPAIIYLALLLVYLVYNAASTARSLQKVGSDATSYLVAPMAIQMGFLVGYLFGYWGMLHAYRTAVRPLLRARPRMAPGLAIRCRSCGGDLPNVHALQIICHYCSAPNLLDDTLTQRADELLQAEIAAYQARAQSVFSSDAFRAPMNSFYRWGAVGAVVGLVLGTTIMLALTSLFS
jgi:hypothetical protein